MWKHQRSSEAVSPEQQWCPTHQKTQKHTVCVLKAFVFRSIDSCCLMFCQQEALLFLSLQTPVVSGQQLFSLDSSRSSFKIQRDRERWKTETDCWNAYRHIYRDVYMSLYICLWKICLCIYVYGINASVCMSMVYMSMCLRHICLCMYFNGIYVNGYSGGHRAHRKWGVLMVTESQEDPYLPL